VRLAQAPRRAVGEFPAQSLGQSVGAHRTAGRGGQPGAQARRQRCGREGHAADEPARSVGGPAQDQRRLGRAGMVGADLDGRRDPVRSGFQLDNDRPPLALTA